MIGNNSEAPKPVEIVLGDDHLHPILSPITRVEDFTVFWVSELDEQPGEPVSHENANCHRVDLEIVSWMRTAEGLTLVGRIASTHTLALYHGITVDNTMYFGNGRAFNDYYERRNGSATLG